MTVQMARVKEGQARNEQGVALIMAMLATLLLSAFTAALVLVGSTETMISANFRNAVEALYAAEGAVEYVAYDLASVVDWNHVLTGQTVSSFSDGTTMPTLPDGTVLDLEAVTSALQGQTDAEDLWGVNNPVWRLYAHGPVAGLLPAGAIDSLVYVAVWVADDPAEIDGNPLDDGNGVLTLRAEAFAPSSARKVVEAMVARDAGQGSVRILSWRELR